METCFSVKNVSHILLKEKKKSLNDFVNEKQWVNSENGIRKDVNESEISIKNFHYVELIFSTDPGGIN